MRIGKLEENIAERKAGMNRAFGQLLAATPGLELDNLKSRPYYENIVKEFQPSIDRETKELETIKPLLPKAEELAGQFKPSGLASVPAGAVKVQVKQFGKIAPGSSEYGQISRAEGLVP